MNEDAQADPVWTEYLHKHNLSQGPALKSRVHKAGARTSPCSKMSLKTNIFAVRWVTQDHANRRPEGSQTDADNTVGAEQLKTVPVALTHHIHAVQSTVTC